MRTLPVARTRRPLRIALALLLSGVTVGLVLLRPDGSRPDLPGAGPTADGRVVAVRIEPCPDTAPEARITCTTAEVRMAGGSVVDATVEVDAAPGDRVVVQDTVAGSVVVGIDRRGPTALLLALGLVVLLVVARAHGLRAAVALAGILAVLTAWGVPAVLDGRSPLGVAAVAGVVAALALTLVVRPDAGGQVAALASALVAVVGSAVLDAVDGMLALPPLAVLGGGVLVAAAAALVAAAAVDATWRFDDVAVEAGWRGVARAGRRGAAAAAARGTVALAAVLVATSVLSLHRFVQGATPVLVVFDGEPLAAPLGWLAATLLVVPLAAPVASSLAAWVAVREAAGTGAGDPRRFRSRGERALWEEDAT